MLLSKNEKEYLDNLCTTFRRDTISLLHDKQTGHPGGSLSVCEILTSLYFHTAKLDSDNLQWPDRDRIVLSKGHAAPMLYRVLAEKGYFPIEEMQTFRDINSRLQGHPCAKETPGVEVSSGPLGICLGAALGMAIALRLNNINSRVFAILGDGEINEGTVWETCLAASKFGADNLTAILDWNGVQLDGTNSEIMPLGNLREKFESFGWHVVECDGHNVAELCQAYEDVVCLNKPGIVLAHTIKGKGVSFMEGKSIWHGKAIGDAEYERAMFELGGEQ